MIKLRFSVHEGHVGLFFIYKKLCENLCSGLCVNFVSVKECTPEYFRVFNQKYFRVFDIRACNKLRTGIIVFFGSTEQGKLFVLIFIFCLGWVGLFDRQLGCFEIIQKLRFLAMIG